MKALLPFLLLLLTATHCYAEEITLTEEQKQELLKALEPKLQRMKSNFEKINQMQQMQQNQDQPPIPIDETVNSKGNTSGSEQKGTSSEQKSLRELLIASENTYEVFVVDDYHTYVRPKTIFFGRHSGEPSEDLAKEIVAACPTQIEINKKQTDLITRETIEKWVPYQEDTYLFHRVEKDNISGEFHNLYGVRCKGEFEIVSTYTSPHTNIGGFGTYNYDLVKAFIIKHEDPQPFLFKSENISFDRITWPEDGEWKPVSMGIGDIFKAIVDKETREDTVVYQYVRALCRKSNGKLRFVINKGEFIKDPKGRWTNLLTGEKGRYKDKFEETDSIGAFNYAATASSVRGPVRKIIFYACEGNKRFVVRSEEDIRHGGDKTYGVPKFYFSSQRGLEGIDYVPLARQEKSETSQVAGPQTPTTMKEQIALEVANKGTNIFKVFGAQEYTGIYNGKDQNNCDLVTVEKNWDTGQRKPRIDSFNYRICNGIIAKTSETGVETLPREMEGFIQKIAKTAQSIGSAEGEYQGYTVKAQALRDRDNCMIEVKIFRDMNLVSDRTVNECQ
ncbi:MAG: hypothetical protein ACK415_04545 [Thermodesulfovibrionales bacterium]